MNKVAVFIGLGALAAAYGISKAADAVAVASGDGGDVALDYINPWGAIDNMVTSYQTDIAVQNTNMQAAQETIAQSEGTASQPDPYRVCYGYRHTIADLRDHPAITGEWMGEKLSDTQCKGAGFGSGCVSTAAGKYQINKPTWLDAKRALSLPDFGPDSQDKACAWIIGQQGATSAVERGDVATFVKLCAKRWASFAGAGYAGQATRSLTSLIAYFQNAGGTLA